MSKALKDIGAAALLLLADIIDRFARKLKRKPADAAPPPPPRPTGPRKPGSRL